MCSSDLDDDMITAEITPCFVNEGGRRTDMIALACTHYPLLQAWLTRLSPWPVAWIDPAPAIARRVVDLTGAPAAEGGPPVRAIFTSGHAPSAALAQALAQFGIARDPQPVKELQVRAI